MFGKSNSNKIAKERLKNILINDRIDTSPEVLDIIKEGIKDVISNYMEADGNSINIKMTHSADGNKAPTLVANIPIKNIKHFNSNVH